MHFCARHVFFRAPASRLECPRTRAQLRGNSGLSIILLFFFSHFLWVCDTMRSYRDGFTLSGYFQGCSHEVHVFFCKILSLCLLWLRVPCAWQHNALVGNLLLQPMPKSWQSSFSDPVYQCFSLLMCYPLLREKSVICLRRLESSTHPFVLFDLF